MLKSCYQKDQVEAGCDEAGRGCLAGPVVAAAVILPSKYRNKHINDSKQIPEKKRYELAKIIRRDAVAWAVAAVSHTEIDRINILNASILGMHQALDQLSVVPQFILVDGNRFKRYKKIAHLCVVEGDAKYLSIAAASLLAKTHRDELMKEYHNSHPHYGWVTNKGYATQEHRDALTLHGPCELHRKSFTLLPEQYSLFD